VKTYSDDWIVNLLDTGLHTMTAGRILYTKEELTKEDSFLLTYGYGLSDVDLIELINSHKKSNSVVILTGVRPSGRFGLLDINVDNKINSLNKKADSESN
jgi:glucose-1-phosphate cytidylyltransferase